MILDPFLDFNHMLYEAPVHGSKIFYDRINHKLSYQNPSPI